MKRSSFILFLFIFLLIGCSKDNTKTELIFDASFGQDRQDAQLGQYVTFYNTSSPSLTQFTWDFGDDSPQVTGARVRHKFYKRGTFYITMIAKSNDGRIQKEYHKSVIIGSKYIREVRLDRLNFRNAAGQYWDVNNYYPVAKIVMTSSIDSSIKYVFGYTDRLTIGKLPYQFYTPNLNSDLDTNIFNISLFALDQYKKDVLISSWILDLRGIYQDPITLDKGDGNTIKIFYNLK